MEIEEIVKRLDAEMVCQTDNKAEAFYAGDFLSRVMGKAPSNSAWLTVMNNVNVAGVAVLAEIKIIILCEGVKAVEILKEKCLTENIGLVETDKGLYEACVLLGK